MEKQPLVTIVNPTADNWIEQLGIDTVQTEKKLQAAMDEFCDLLIDGVIESDKPNGFALDRQRIILLASKYADSPAELATNLVYMLSQVDEMLSSPYMGMLVALVANPKNREEIKTIITKLRKEGGL